MSRYNNFSYAALGTIRKDANCKDRFHSFLGSGNSIKLDRRYSRENQIEIALAWAKKAYRFNNATHLGFYLGRDLFLADLATNIIELNKD